MRISKINGHLTEPFKYYSEEDGEKFYISSFKIEDGLTIPVISSEYIKEDTADRLLLTGHLCSSNRRANAQGRSKLFTFFRIRKIEHESEEEPVKKLININGKIINVMPIDVANNGIEYLTLIAKEYYDYTKTSIIHYNASGALARKLSATIKVGDNVTGKGILHARGKTYEVALSDLKLRQKKGGNRNELTQG